MHTETRHKMHTALFEDKDAAESAYSAALKRGYRPEDINIVMSEDSRKKYYDSPLVEREMGDKSLEGLAIGGAIGGSVLGTIGAIVALSTTIVVPGIGLVIAGPLAASLVGVGAGSIAGGLLGTLIGAGIPEEHAKIYENGIKKGGIVVAVPPRHDNDALLEDWKRANGRNIY